MYLKICCISSIDEARLAIAHGASALGLVSHMPSGPGVIDDRTIASIAAAVPPHIATFLLTSERTGDAIAARALASGVTAVQIVDHVDPSVLGEVRAIAPTLRIVQVIHVEGEDALEIAARAEPHADALLLDSGRPSAAILGGTGQTHDWEISARICASARVPVFLAGGLRPSNVRDAIARVRPRGLDVCSGLRVGGALDEATLRAFVSQLELTAPPIWPLADAGHAVR